MNGEELKKKIENRIRAINKYPTSIQLFSFHGLRSFVSELWEIECITDEDYKELRNLVEDAIDKYLGLVAE